ncbi:MAG: hypothetical protein QW540_08745 [Archaeoglobaceae archaeon]
MESVVSFKVNRKLKEKMESLGHEINWPEELRKFVETKIREIEAKKGKERTAMRLESAAWFVPDGFSAKIVRENRDGD